MKIRILLVMGGADRVEEGGQAGIKKSVAEGGNDDGSY